MTNKRRAARLEAAVLAYKRAVMRYTEQRDEDAEWEPLAPGLIDAKWRDESAARTALFGLVPAVALDAWEKR